MGGMDLTNETDFLELYRRLGLAPGCGQLEFKRAYRRRVSLLHPDHRVGCPLDARAAERLQQLTAQYSAAMEFQRRHGRLPGAPASPRPAVTEVAAPAWRAAPPTRADESRRRHSRVLMLFAVMALGVLVWDVASLPSSSDIASTYVAGDAGAGPSVRVAAPMLALGMSPDEVRVVEGEPVAIRDDRWEYGPSWIRFEQDAVVDWYSSPLHSLHTPDAGRLTMGAETAAGYGRQAASRGSP